MSETREKSYFPKNSEKNRSVVLILARHLIRSISIRLMFVQTHRVDPWIEASLKCVKMLIIHRCWYPFYKKFQSVFCNYSLFSQFFSHILVSFLVSFESVFDKVFGVAALCRFWGFHARKTSRKNTNPKRRLTKKAQYMLNTRKLSKNDVQRCFCNVFLD